MTTIDSIAAESRADERRSGRGAARLLICDEQPGTRHALADCVAEAPWVGDILCVANGFELVDAFGRGSVDLVLIGQQAGRMGGVRATELLLSLHPAAAVIAFGPPEATAMLTAAVNCGARGLMLWEAAGSNQPRLTVGGWSAHRQDEQNGERVNGGAHRLTERELQVLRGMSEGQSNADIGRDLFLSEDTIKTHARRLFGKLGAKDRAHAVALGLRNSYVH